VEIPEEIARPFRYLFDSGEQYLSNYLVPFDVLNRYQPFTFERV